MSDEASLFRTVRFRASHRYPGAGQPTGAPETSHEHEWALTVTVRGEIDPRTGFVVDLPALDEVLRHEVVARFDGKDLNEEVAPVRAGAMQPSTEALARWLFERLAPRMPGGARLVRVRLAEDDTLAAEYRGE